MTGKDSSEACAIACQTVQFTQLFRQVWRHTVKALSLTESVQGTLHMALRTNRDYLYQQHELMGPVAGMQYACHELTGPVAGMQYACHEGGMQSRN
jgi:hypothetical protein